MAEDIWEYYARDVSRAVEYMTAERDKWRDMAMERAEQIRVLEVEVARWKRLFELREAHRADRIG